MRPFRPDLLQGTKALVTGGGTGIGKAVARALMEVGAEVVLASRKVEHLEPTRAEIERAGGRCHAFPCDIREPDQVGRLVDQTLEVCGRIDLLVNNAGGQFPSSVEGMSPKGWATVINTNLNGTFNVTHAVATRWMIPHRGGRIVSIVANMWRGFPGLAHTGAARAGVVNLTQSLAIEWAQYGIRVNAIAPGIIDSGGLKVYPPEVVRMSRRTIPLMRFGTPEEVALAVVFLASPGGDFMTGETLRIDGGQALWGDLWPIPDPEPSGSPA